MQKTLVTILGVVFVAIGVLGFFNQPLLGIFAVDTVHNIIHLLSGVLALWAVSMGEGATRTYAKIFGVVYLIVAVLGFLMPGSMVLGLFAVNMADNVLHLVLAALFLYAGFTKPAMVPASAAPMGGGM